MYASIKPRWDKWDQFKEGMKELGIGDDTPMINRVFGIPGKKGYYLKEGKAYSESNIARLGKWSDDPVTLMRKGQEKSLAELMGIGEDVDELYGGAYKGLYTEGLEGRITEDTLKKRKQIMQSIEGQQGSIGSGVKSGEYEGTPLGREYRAHMKETDPEGYRSEGEAQLAGEAGKRVKSVEDWTRGQRDIKEQSSEKEALDILEREHGQFQDEAFESDPRAYIFGDRGVDPLTKAFGPSMDEEAGLEPGGYKRLVESRQKAYADAGGYEGDDWGSGRLLPGDEMPVDPITRAFGPAYTQEERDTMALKEKEMITKNITRKHESMQKTGSALVKDIQSTPGFEEYAPRGMDEDVRRSLLSIPGAG